MLSFPLIHARQTLLTQDVVLTSIQRHLNVTDVRWTLKQRCVLTGKSIKTYETLSNYKARYVNQYHVSQVELLTNTQTRIKNNNNGINLSCC